MLIDRRVIDQVGGFDTSFGLGGGEETDFNERARFCGWRLAWARGAFVYHVGHASFNQLIAEGQIESMDAVNRASFDRFYKYRQDMLDGKRSPLVPLKKTGRSGPLMNILTRTHERPESFKRCRQSILAQVWSGQVRHLVATDGKCPYAEGDVVMRVRSPKTVEIPADFKEFRPAPWNLYVNDLMKKVEDGWILVMDDDDEFLRPNALSLLEPYLEDENNLIIPRIWYLNRSMPSKLNFGSRFVEGDIAGSGGFIFHSRHREIAKWIGCYGGDYYAACNLADRLDVVWLDVILQGTQNGTAGEGQRLRVKAEAWKPRLEICRC